ncbi:hypothetical protein BKA67DRAFT_656232 [Truncatella angustata]|uniref:Tautomerase cis-CaaD-like domain-containing protein n=1 Tax=Truncatella angustata TaxID=152316 RepID=A0A9P8US38_9PEZI|nr:uncharacterized protein BKA67DRAFT_656232 [Truncatella angustata]KAH6658000.1 hypothetical protein BKA67DRAFT_656232 [Truncatella angustata]KAH8193975.1 hypothetical protein TruAng_011862 [Truncatella angustata]
MPMYEIEHIAPLTQIQKDALAQAITEIHSSKFTTPRIFVNVKITDARQQVTYVAGNARPSNRITAHVRTSASRTQEDFNQLCNNIHVAWSSIVHPGHPTKPPADQELRAVFIFGDIVAGWEAGFAIPSAGQDAQWARDNLEAFKEKARAGDEDFEDLVHELSTREEFQQSGSVELLK